MGKPTGKHSDWWWPFSLIPRSLNSWSSEKEPTMLIGNVPKGLHLDVPPPGRWALTSPLTFVFRTKAVCVVPSDFKTIEEYAEFKHSVSFSFAAGLARFDYLARYYTWPRFTFKFYGGFWLWLKARLRKKPPQIISVATRTELESSGVIML